jgi:hypothetical protein
MLTRSREPRRPARRGRRWEFVVTHDRVGERGAVWQRPRRACRPQEMQTS